MDFTSALANLAKSAAAANDNSNNNKRPRTSATGNDTGRPETESRRPRTDSFESRGNHNNSYYGPRGAGGGRGYRGGRGPRGRGRGGGGTSSYYGNVHERSPLDGLLRYGYRVGPTALPYPKLEDTTTTSVRHIALLALTIDDLPFEHIWKEWIATANNNNNTGEDKVLVSLVCHAKYPDQVKSPWLQKRLLVKPPRKGRGDSFADPEFHSYAPEWGSIQLTRAMIDSLATAMKIGRQINERSKAMEEDPRFTTKRFLVTDEATDDNDTVPPVDTFIFISETCLPVRTLPECVKEIYGESTMPNEIPAAETKTETDEDAQGDDNPPVEQEVPSSVPTPPADTDSTILAAPRMSWVKARNRNTPGTPRNKYERDQFTDINHIVPQQHRWKADQWILLTRPHAAAVLDIDQHLRPGDRLWTAFSRISASDEMYFPTALSLIGLLTEQANNDTKESSDTVPETTLIPSSLSSQIASRQVTYVDWSEGMRNPATYDKGLRDFGKVARLARKNGSLFARKFVPHSMSHSLAEDKPMTGTISAEEWLQEVTRLAQEET